MRDNKKIAAPSISLPKGGGAIKGIGETFQPNPFTGTGNLSLPIFNTPCRDSEPKLNLNYSSGSGNGLFGLGFDLSIPNVCRKTEKGLPQYGEPDEDTFILSDAEDLVPQLVQKGNQWVRDERPMVVGGMSYKVTRYWPRTEGLFARIELWRDLATGDTHWEVISKENIKSVYGKKPAARIADPSDPLRVFKWLIEETQDDKGNRILYEYKAEDEQNVPNDVNEATRIHTANKYIKRIRYGNYFDGTNVEQWAFEIIFDYGEHDLNHQVHKETITWPKRKDSFSSYRAGFEIRTHRLCHRILMFHHLAELGHEPCLVRSTDFEYDETPVMSFLKAIRQKGYQKKDSQYDRAEIPPLELQYSTFDPTAHFFQPLLVESRGMIPGLINQSGFLLVDLYGEGIAGVLYSDDTTIMYWRGKGGGTFDQPQKVQQFPLERTLTGSQHALMDLGGDGKLDLVVQAPSRAGFYQSNPDGTWEPFKSFESYPVLDLRSSDKEMVDLNGDGFADLLVIEDDYLSYYTSRAKQGYSDPIRLMRVHDADTFLETNHASREEVLRFADMFGDGLSHRVRVRNGIVECWPNLGYGRFGQRVLFGNAPHFGEKLDAARLFFADIDGSGTTDLIYVHKDRLDVYFNQSGNAFSNPVSIHLPQGFDSLDQIQVADVLGNGTSCVVLTKNEAGYPGLRHDYYDFTGGIKPHLLVAMTDNMGATTRVKYASSTKFYLEDERAGKPWISRLPFPVHVIEKTETVDHISGSKLVTTYKYHHGYFDGEEREFRGFGCVEQWDTQAFEQFSQPGLLDVPFEVNEAGLHVPPVCARTWYHTGAFETETVLSRQYEAEYYHADPQARLLPDSVFDTTYSSIYVESLREAYRALRGQVLRQEIYAKDNKPGLSQHPYTVTESNFVVRLLQSREGQKHAVFFVHPYETITYHYERIPDDPRIEHQFTLEVDEFGNVLRSCTVYYPRRPATGRHVYPEQAQIRAVTTVKQFINETAQFYLLGVPCENQRFEIGGLNLKGSSCFSFEELQGQLSTALQPANILRFDQPLSHQQLQSRLLTWQRHYYWNKAQTDILPLCSVTERALLHHSEEAVFSAPQVQAVFGGKVTGVMLQNEAQYRLADGYWWNPGLIQHYGKNKVFYLPTKTEDPFGAETIVQYDQYRVGLVQVQDPLKNTTQAELDYAVIQPKKITDLNDNISEVRFDPLGMIRATSLYGTEDGQAKGDTPLSQYQDVAATSVQAVLANPETCLQSATSYFYYDLFAWKNRGEPAFVLNLLRETHVSELSGAAKSEIQFNLAYSDGFGREIQKKIKVEPGQAFLRDNSGQLLRDAAGKPVEGLTPERWLVSGRTVYNNKAKPVKQYEPFYSSIAHYEPEKELTEYGVTPVIHYDPLLRVVRTDTPKGFYSKVEFSPWLEESWDENDTISDSQFYQSNLNNNTPEFQDEKDALTKALQHANTPRQSVLTNFGKRFLQIEQNLDTQQLNTYYELDINGNELSITDPRQYKLNLSRPAQKKVRNFVYVLDMVGGKLSINSVDAGVNLTLNNAMGKPIHAWDSRGFHVATKYDKLQRPVEIHVADNGLNQIVEKMNYGEGQPNDKAQNLRGELITHYDQAGVQQFNLYDIHGEARHSQRQLRAEYKVEVNWNNPAAVALEDEPPFVTETKYDALKRIASQKNPDESVYRPKYHPFGLLKRVEVTFKGDTDPTVFVEAIGYNPKGQREQIVYGNGVLTEYTYERETFRLTHLKTYRNRDGKLLQDIYYTYDPVGNITRIIDYSHERVFHDQALVEPRCDYTYDTLYQLIAASGREHPALTQDDIRNGAFKQSRFLPLWQQGVHPNDIQKLQPYTETYTYDASGNLTEMRHIAAQSARSWTRIFVPAETSNRTIPQEMLQAGVTPEDFFDANGNLMELEHLREIRWNYRDNIAAVDLIQRANAPSDSEYYVYDGYGDRACKVCEHYINGGTIVEIEEKLYLGNFEVKRIKQKTNQGMNTILERCTLHIMDDKRRIALIHQWSKDNYRREINHFGERKIHYQFTNHLDSCSLELNGDAEIINYEEYFPYGGTSMITGDNQREVKVKEYRYSGKERDDHTGLYYFGVRYYAPWMGRWMNCDPIGEKGGLNAYEFAMANPIRYHDPRGFAALEQAEGLLKIANLLAGSTKVSTVVNVAVTLLDRNIHQVFETRTAKELLPRVLRGLRSDPLLQEMPLQARKYIQRVVAKVVLTASVLSEHPGDVLSRLRSLLRVEKLSAVNWGKPLLERTPGSANILHKPLAGSLTMGVGSIGLGLLGSYWSAKGQHELALGANIGSATATILGAKASASGLAGGLFSGTALPLASAFLGGYAVGKSIDALVEKYTGKALSTRWADAMLGREFAEARKYREEHTPFRGVLVLPNQSYNDIRQAFTRWYPKSVLPQEVTTMPVSQSMSFNDISEALK